MYVHFVSFKSIISLFIVSGMQVCPTNHFSLKPTTINFDLVSFYFQCGTLLKEKITVFLKGVALLHCQKIY